MSFTLPDRRFYFISGLPRSGSTLLAAILRQNPRFHAGMQSSLFDVFSAAQRALSNSESACLLSDTQRDRVLRGIVDSFYAHLPENRVVFDTNRMWSGHAGALSSLFPGARIVCCLRDPAWIIDSVERLVAKTPVALPKMFGFDVAGTVFSRAEALMTHQSLGPALRAVLHTWHSPHARMLVAIPYDSLTAKPAEVIAQLYAALGEAPCDHDFTSVTYDEPDFDNRLGLPGMHRVEGPVKATVRKTTLPADLFAQYSAEFWRDPDSNPNHVPVL